MGLVCGEPGENLENLFLGFRTVALQQIAADEGGSPTLCLGLASLRVHVDDFVFQVADNDGGIILIDDGFEERIKHDLNIKKATPKNIGSGLFDYEL